MSLVFPYDKKNSLNWERTLWVLIVFTARARHRYRRACHLRIRQMACRTETLGSWHRENRPTRGLSLVEGLLRENQVAHFLEDILKTKMIYQPGFNCKLYWRAPNELTTRGLCCNNVSVGFRLMLGWGVVPILISGNSTLRIVCASAGLLFSR